MRLRGEAGLADRLARAVHAVHGTRGLGISAGLLLAISLLEPALPPGFPRILLVIPAFALLVTGLLTLPREGVAAQDRALALLEHPAPVAPMVRRLLWIGLTVFLLLPRVFLGVYANSPHLNPLAGLVLPDILRRVALAFLFVVLLAPIAYLRSSRRYAPHIRVRRPVEIDRAEEGGLDRRDILLILTYLLLVAWAYLLSPFWRPFTLLEWPPGLGSLTQGTRGVAAISFALAPPLVLFASLVAHLTLLRRLRSAKGWPHLRGVTALALVHVALILLAVALHMYDLLWIARYQILSGF